MLRLSLLHSKPYRHLHSKVNSNTLPAPNYSLLMRPIISVARALWQIPPSSLTTALVLSATPVRQYDETGTEALFRFLGPVVFRFGLEEAIGKCLVEYDYYVHPVELTKDEMDRWSSLTARIKQNAWRLDGDEQNGFIAKLLRDRRAILEKRR